MADQKEIGGRKVVRSHAIKRIEEASADPAQPRRLFIDSPTEGIDEEEFIPTDPQSAADAQVGDTALIDEDGTHHVIRKESDDKDKKDDGNRPAGLVKGGPNRPATETNLEPSPTKRGG
jgi:hypothetical protein